MNKPSESIITYCARLHLAEQLGIKPDDLDYLGPLEVGDNHIEMFNVMAEGPLKYSTRSVVIPV